MFLTTMGGWRTARVFDTLDDALRYFKSLCDLDHAKLGVSNPRYDWYTLARQLSRKSYSGYRFYHMTLGDETSEPVLLKHPALLQRATELGLLTVTTTTEEGSP